MGPYLVRNFAGLNGATLAGVADLDPRKLELVKKRFPAVKTTTDFQELLKDPEIDAIAIATPVNTHFELGMAALKAGKHLWLEKPMAETSLQARMLVDEAQRRKLVLLVDHTFLYTGAVRKMGEVIKSGELGRVFYYDSDAREPGSVPARRQRDIGSGRARLRHPRLSSEPDGQRLRISTRSSRSRSSSNIVVSSHSASAYGAKSLGASRTGSIAIPLRDRLDCLRARVEVIGHSLTQALWLLLSCPLERLACLS